MKAKRWISLLLAVSMMLGVLAMPASAAAQQPESTAVVSEELPDAAALSAAEDENDIVNIRIRATGNLVYGSDYNHFLQFVNWFSRIFTFFLIIFPCVSKKILCNKKKGH